MKRRDYEMSIEIEVKNAGTISDFARGMEVGAITMLKHIISIDRDLDEEDRLFLLEKAEHARMDIVEKSWIKSLNSRR